MNIIRTAVERSSLQLTSTQISWSLIRLYVQLRFTTTICHPVSSSLLEIMDILVSLYHHANEKNWIICRTHFGNSSYLCLFPVIWLWEIRKVSPYLVLRHLFRLYYDKSKTFVNVAFCEITDTSELIATPRTRSFLFLSQKKKMKGTTKHRF